MKYPALDVRGADADRVLTLVDDFAPTAVEDLEDGLSIFFSHAQKRDEARAAVEGEFPHAAITAREVDDEDWARRSQENLTPVTVGAITVTPPWCMQDGQVAEPAHHAITILPSMGFGTGHHPTTRLCLAALQSVDLHDKRVLDVGTGSGVLALAAAALGAREALGIDFDLDAVTNARENLELNPHVGNVRFETVDVRDAALPAADVVLANLTGAVLLQNASLLTSTVAAGGTLIISGLQTHERDEVVGAFQAATVRWSGEEAGWEALAFNFPAAGAV